jgi:hypothetical protein
VQAVVERTVDDLDAWKVDPLMLPRAEHDDVELTPEGRAILRHRALSKTARNI